jgi:gliding motility-associated-like protein
MIKCKILYLFVLIFEISNFAYAQKQANVWHLGNNRTIDFSSGEPVEISGSAISAYEGCASYCDSLGNILFYSNGGGYETFGPTGNIWNAANESIYDMQGIEGGGYSAMQSSVFIEAPGEPGKYYLFTMDDREYYLDASDSVMNAQPQGRGLSYFKIDKSLNSGLGGVTETESVYAPSAEGLCAVKHTNGNDYWILINQDSSGIGIYSVTSAGVQLSSVFNITEGTFYMIKASPDGTKIFALLDEFPAGMGVLLQFDPATGILSNTQELSTYDGFFYFDFSPNSRYLYFANGTTIGRYDLNSSNIANSYTSFFDFSGIEGFSYISQLQLGPDGKLYVLFVEYDIAIGLPVNTLNRISCPNTVSPVFECEVLTFIGNPSFGNFNGLPNFPAWIFKNNDDVTVSLGPENLELCESDFPYTLNAQNPGATYLWSDGSTTQTIQITGPGNYSVQVNNFCGTGSGNIYVSPCTQTINCIEFLPTGATQSWIVPAGVDSISVKMWGAAGGGGPDSLNNAGGGGGYTQFSLPVIPGDILQIEVGTGGQKAVGNTGGDGGWPSGGDGGDGNRNEINFGIPTDVGGAGGGGGKTVIRMAGSINQLLAIAGGGGGAAYNRAGGAGGGLQAEYTTASNSFDVNGFGGSQTAGGAPGNNTICTPPALGQPGTSLAGGDGANDIADPNTGGGGGGDGFYGGGGGSSHDGCFGVGSTGGGGSGYLCAVCPGLIGNTLTGGFFGIPANQADALLTNYPGTAAGVNNTNGGGGLVQICYSSVPCSQTTATIIETACSNYTAPWGATYNQTGTYSDTIVNSNGCDSIIQLNLTITGLPSVTAESDSASCGLPNGIATAAATGGSGNFSYNWSNGATGSFVTGLAAGSYSVIATDQNGCTASAQVSVSSTSASGVSLLANDTFLEYGDSVTLQVLGANTYLWAPPDGLSCTNCPSVIASPLASTVYQVTGVDSSGCGYLLNVKIEVEIELNEIFVPDAFSPNSDGINDKVFVRGSIKEFSFSVFNRWGEAVFRTQNQSTGWDGSFRGKELDAGVFVYYISGTDAAGNSFNKKGNINLVK